MKNHQKSKKHKEKFTRLQAEMKEENDLNSENQAQGVILLTCFIFIL